MSNHRRQLSAPPYDSTAGDSPLPFGRGEQIDFSLFGRQVVAKVIGLRRASVPLLGVRHALLSWDAGPWGHLIVLESNGGIIRLR